MSRNRLATDALQARVAARLIGAIAAAQPALAPDTAERLRFARQMAMQRAREHRALARPQPAPAQVPSWRLAGVGGDAAAGFSPPVPWWQRAAALLPLMVLVAGLVGIDHWATQEQIATVADIDAELLADDLPPEAYTDPGFVEYLRSEPAEEAP
jgi:Protein of unknown function (DUF3619)